MGIDGRAIRIGILIFVLAASACRTTAGVPDVTVCEIGERPPKFAGREVVLAAEVIADKSGMRFVDRRCSGQWIGWEVAGSMSWKEVDRLLRDLARDGRSGHFRGVVRVDGRRVTFELSEVIERGR